MLVVVVVVGDDIDGVVVVVMVVLLLRLLLQLLLLLPVVLVADIPVMLMLMEPNYFVMFIAVFLVSKLLLMAVAGQTMVLFLVS